MTQLWWKLNSACLATYWMHILSIKLIFHSMWKKVRKTRTDGRSDGRTLPRHDTTFFFKRALKTEEMKGVFGKKTREFLTPKTTATASSRQIVKIINKTKTNRGQETHYISVCTKSEEFVLIHEATSAEQGHSYAPPLELLWQGTKSSSHPGLSG